VACNVFQIVPAYFATAVSYTGKTIMNLAPDVIVINIFSSWMMSEKIS
jgi:hypothetical protein